MEQKKQRQEPPMATNLETIPTSVLVTNVLPKLEFDTLCSLACVSKSLNSSVSEALPFLSSLNLAAFCPKPEILGRILRQCRCVRSLKLSCLRLNDSSFTRFLGKNVEELELMFCSFLTYDVMVSIGEDCPNLRVLVLELRDESSSWKFKTNMDKMLDGCPRLKGHKVVQCWDSCEIQVWIYRRRSVTCCARKFQNAVTLCSDSTEKQSDLLCKK